MKNYYLTSESVTEGHPDKICDKISDYILDEALKQDKNSKMAVEATIKDELILIYGEATTNAKLNYEQLAKRLLKEIGYKEEYNVIVKVNKQSIEINNAVNKDKIMAGDQGIMFGYATNETKEYMPLTILLANKLDKRLTDVRKQAKDSILRPDGKTQVTIEYEDDLPKRVDTIIIASQHKENIDYDILKEKYTDGMLDELISVMAEAICGKSGTVRIGGNEFAREVVKSQLLKITDEHVEYVLDCIKKNTTKIRNIKAYMLTCIYSAPQTISSYYTAEVNHDLYGCS